MLKKNSFWLGVGIGLAGPLMLFGIIALVKVLLGQLAIDKAMFVCVALNVVPIRYYFITAQLDRTGRGVLAITVILIVTVTMMHL
jgi:hypothetical protein